MEVNMCSNATAPGSDGHQKKKCMLKNSRDVPSSTLRPYLREGNGGRHTSHNRMQWAAKTAIDREMEREREAGEIEIFIPLVRPPHSPYIP